MPKASDEPGGDNLDGARPSPPGIFCGQSVWLEKKKINDVFLSLTYMTQDMSQEDMYNLLTTKWLEPELTPDGSRATSTRSSVQSSWRVTEDIFSSVVHLTTSYTVVSLAWMCFVGDFCREAP